MARYTLRRRRPRPRRRARRFRRIRRRRIYIRRPTNNGTVVQKFCKTEPFTLQNQDSTNAKKWMQGSYTTTLSEWVSSPGWDFYKILKLKLTFLPFNATQRMNYWPIGNTIIDLDGPWNEPNTVQSNLLCNTATSRLWKANRKHSRYFTPRPLIHLTGNTTSSQASALLPRRTWWNSAESTVKWGGLKYSHYVEYNQPVRYWLIKSAWIKWKYLL
ncbi:capsid protein [Human circovirus 1]|uniref:capsid protein n=1 Tax=Human circovirus 1 TaxID=3025750 RepID=UPI0027988A11|nr:capsid protein [Human circovirus 1]WHP53076.1 capsid protein [Human circovirus 1]